MPSTSVSNEWPDARRGGKTHTGAFKRDPELVPLPVRVEQRHGRIVSRVNHILSTLHGGFRKPIVVRVGPKDGLHKRHVVGLPVIHFDKSQLPAVHGAPKVPRRSIALSTRGAYGQASDEIVRVVGNLMHCATERWEKEKNVGGERGRVKISVLCRWYQAKYNDLRVAPDRVQVYVTFVSWGWSRPWSGCRWRAWGWSRPWSGCRWWA